MPVVRFCHSVLLSHRHRINNYTPDLSRSVVDATIAQALKLYSDVIPLNFKRIYFGTADIIIMFSRRGNEAPSLLSRKCLILVLTLLSSYTNQPMEILLHSMGKWGLWPMHSPPERATEVTPILMKTKPGLWPQQVLTLRKHYYWGDIIS